MTWNKNIIHGQGFGQIGTPGVPNYANSDDSKLEDRERPRDEYGFRVQNNSTNTSTLLDTFNAERYLDTSGSGLTYQEIKFTPGTVGTHIENNGNSALLNNDGHIVIARNGTYIISAQAQNTKDGEFVVARLYEGPIGWKWIRVDAEDKLELSVASLTKVVRLQKGDILIPLCGTKSSVGLSGTLWFSVVKIG